MSQPLEALFQDHRAFLWGLCYRMTGNAADAEDLVQDTFMRVMKRPPRETEAPWRPWLVRVAMNLARDLLRRRRRRHYDGPWLPSPIETDSEAAAPSDDPHARYDTMESVSFAFLIALEALTPAQRAVLLLRDVFDYSVADTAKALWMTQTNVKTTHHRARRVMDSYDRGRREPTRDVQEETRRALERFLACLTNGDVAGAEALLAEGARHTSDAAGEFAAARVPVEGRDKVLRLYTQLAAKLLVLARFELRTFNALPGILVSFEGAPPGIAPRFVTRCDLDARGRIQDLHVILATKKLTAVG